VNLIAYDRAPRKIVEAIKRNELVGFLIDFGINAHKDINTVPVRFFGEVTQFPSSPALLARRYAAPLFVAFARIAPNDEIHITVEPPLEVARDLPREEAERLTMQQIADRFVKYNRECPEQWYVFRPMWPQSRSRRASI
jgi:lauroyl/myristoyl acyltransferase